MTEQKKRRNLAEHPCFHGEASGQWGRVHLPVAPQCNIQCNFCNRLYDCVNESRPGVTGRILGPGEAVAELSHLLQRRSDIAVVGIAGPGDPLCEPEKTLETLRGVHSRYPELLICVSTNGLNLLEQVEDLAKAGVTHLTVTVNGIDPEIAGRIYSWIRWQGQTYHGTEAAEILLERQAAGIQAAKKRNMIVKVNTVVLPGINDEHIPVIAKAAVAWGADVMNCMPLIPIHDTPFSHLPPTSEGEMARVRKSISHMMPQIYHCRRCRADAAGLLGEDTGQECGAASAG